MVVKSQLGVEKKKNRDRIKSPGNYSLLSKKPIICCATVKEKINFGPTTKSFGVKPLKNAPNPSFLTKFLKIVTPLSGLSKGLFWILVLTTSKGAATVIEAVAPATLAIVSWKKVASL
mmetsp:Transcript_17546/g.22101  ORF Transcript_17546/g.22101 Transcript_17546/m.22101 type:complete len:118 (+) Transcript_17546:34-387(+)